MKKLLFTLLFLTFGATNAQSQNQSQINDAVWLQIGSDTYTNLTFNEITKSGSFAGCEVVYRYVYRDYRSRNGQPVILTGSITSNYSKGMVFNLFLKVQPHVFDLNGKDGQIKSIQPHFATMVIGKTNLDKYRTTKFTCEDGGYCAAYASAHVVEFIKTVFSQTPFNPEILLNLSPNGMDSKFRLSDIEQNGKPPNSEMDKFTMCLTKVLEEQLQELDKK